MNNRMCTYLLRGVLVLILSCLGFLVVNAQEYKGRTVFLFTDVAGRAYLAGSLPKSHDGVYQKLKIVINGGNWHSNNLAENCYYISTRDGIAINQEVHGGAYSKYDFKVFDAGDHYDFVVIPTEAFPSFNIRAWTVDQYGYTPIEITDCTLANKTDITSMVSINQLYVTASNGSIGIGKNPDVSYKLDVAGTIRATEIKVEAATTTQLNVDGTIHAANIKVAANGQTADFVFEDGYDLKDLAEVETYIKEHKHLPNIPSATDMEANGVDVAEMNKLLLQKVEELTLYVIELKKENESLKKLESEILEIKALITKP